MHRFVFLASCCGCFWLLLGQQAQAQWYAGSQSYALNVDKYDSRYGEAKPVRWSQEVPPLRPPWWTFHRPFRWLKGLAHPDPYHMRAPWDRRHPPGRCCHGTLAPSGPGWVPSPQPLLFHHLWGAAFSTRRSAFSEPQAELSPRSPLPHWR